jgi:negative regulator of replication initiation
MIALRQIAVDVDVHRVIENSRQSFNESENDILRRLLSLLTDQKQQIPYKEEIYAPLTAARNREPVTRALVG